MNGPFVVTPEVCQTPEGIISLLFIVRKGDKVVYVGTTRKITWKWIQNANKN